MAIDQKELLCNNSHVKNEIKEILEKGLIHAVFSNPLNKAAEKVEIRPVKTKTREFYQITELRNSQAKQINLEDCLDYIINLLALYKQLVIFTETHDYHILKGEKILKKPPTKTKNSTTHNQTKNYLLQEGTPLPFLIELGVMTPAGKVIVQKMAKFRQINRFLEMVEDTLSSEKISQVIDFGCGKAYLTFALYHYLKEVKGYPVQMVGIDLKKDVIDFCNRLAKKLKWFDLHFVEGDIALYNPKGPVDMVVALHACDTATDHALAQAIQWKSRIILAAPCCQKELHKQIKSNSLQPILQYGILKERFAAIATDAARAKLLEIHGYTTQLLEFIDPEETPKNLLIRAVFGNTSGQREHAQSCYLQFKSTLNISPTLEKLL